MEKYVKGMSSSARADRKVIALTVLSACMGTIMQSGFAAMEQLADESLSSVNGQNGITITSVNQGITADSLYWEDQVGQPTGAEVTRRMSYGTVAMTSNTAGINYHTTTAKINTGSSAGVPSLDLQLTTSPFTLSAQSMKICDSLGTTCGASAGGFAVQTTSDITLGLTTTNGLFNQNGTLRLVAPLTGINTYYTTKGLSGTETGQKNQFILKNFRLNIDATGKIWVDPTEGLRIQASIVDLKAGTLTDGSERETGFNLPMMYKENAGSGFSTTGAKSFIRIGASGRLVNTDIWVRGIDEKNSTGVPILGYATNAGGTAGTGTDAKIMGSKGIAVRLRTEFTKSGTTDPTKFELGQSGDRGYGLEFSNLSQLNVATSNTANPYLDTGNVYLNIANTRDIVNPQNTVLNTLKLTTAADYTQKMHDKAINPDMLVVAMRGGEFQALALRSRFIANGQITGTDLPSTTTQTWGLALPIYNLNSNFVLYGDQTPATKATSGAAIYSNGTYERLGFGLTLGTTGRDATGSKTTSILLIDSSDQDSNGIMDNRYFGFRNIDMLISARGSLGLEGGSLNLNMPDLTIIGAAELAVGYLPGANAATPANSFTLRNDVLLGVNLKLKGAMDLSVIPGDTSILGNNFMTFAGTYKLTDGSIQLADSAANNPSRIGFDEMSGVIGFSNNIKVQKDNVQFNYGLNFNPSKTASDVFRMKSLNFYPLGSTVPQRLGEAVITGGSLSANLMIKPR